jgi:hypothetical protein
MPQDAKAVFARIVAARPDDVSSLLGLGQCELELKDYPAAEITFASGGRGQAIALAAVVAPVAILVPVLGVDAVVKGDRQVQVDEPAGGSASGAVSPSVLR